MQPRRRRAAAQTLVAVALLCVTPLLAQQARLDELNKKIDDLFSKEDYAGAVPYATEAVKVAETTFGPDDARLAEAVSHLGELYVHLQKADEAERLYKRALEIEKKAVKPNDPDLAQAYNNLGELYDALGRYAEAEPLLKSALEINVKAFGSEDATVARALNNLAELYEDESKPGLAEPLFVRSLAIREKTLKPGDPGIATALSNLSALYREQGDYARAEPLALRALKIDEKALQADDPDVAIDLNNLASIYENEARYAEAEPLYLQSLHIREKAGAEDAKVATALSNLADLYREQGKFQEAAPLLSRAFKIDLKAHGAESLELAIDSNNIAGLLHDDGEYAEALPFYKKALDLYEKLLQPDHATIADVLSNMAVVSPDADAEPLLLRAMRIDEKALGPDDPALVFPLNNLANVYVSQRRFEEAEPLYQRAVTIQEKALGPDHPQLADTLFNFGQLYTTKGSFLQADPKFQRGLNILFDQFQYNFTYMTEKDRLSFLESVALRFPCYFTFVNRFHELDPALAGSMYDLLLWQKGFIASSIASMRRQIEASGDAEALKLLGQLTQKRTQLAALLDARPGETANGAPDALAAWRNQIDRLRGESDAIEKLLVARSSAFAEKKKLERATWQQVRDALKPNEAAVEFARFDVYPTPGEVLKEKSLYVALVVTAETKTEPQYIVLGSGAQIEGDTLSNFEATVETRGFREPAQAALPGVEAYNLIWKPLAGALAGKTRIYLSADGVLNTLPMGIIPAPDGKLLMETLDLRLVSSTKDILRAAPANSGAKTALLVGDPDFDEAEAQEQAALAKLGTAGPAAGSGSQMAEASLPDSFTRGGGAKLARLPGTGAEVSAIAEIMQVSGWTAMTYTRDLALKRVVEQAASPRVVHLATHGFFLPDAPVVQASPADAVKGPKTATAVPIAAPVAEDPMVRSGLYFAGANRTLAGKGTPESVDNGVLTALEAGNLNFTGTELVVLSACNTGQGKVQNGEGVFGLRRALQEAGAQSVMMSLWPVPDQETRDLMQIFYKRWLAGMEKHQALKEAQLEMREKVKGAHEGQDLPSYWAAFVLVGR